MGPTTFTRVIQMGPTHPTPTCVLTLHEAASEAAPLQGNLRYRWSPLALSKFLRWVPFRLSNWGPLGPYFIVQNDLREQIKSDPLPAAVLWVETTLRPAWVRRAEYIYWKVCTIVAHHRAMQMTVGLAQMKVWLWKEFLQTETHKTLTIADWENPLV